MLYDVQYLQYVILHGYTCCIVIRCSFACAHDKNVSCARWNDIAFVARINVYRYRRYCNNCNNETNDVFLRGRSTSCRSPGHLHSRYIGGNNDASDRDTPVRGHTRETYRIAFVSNAAVLLKLFRPL